MGLRHTPRVFQPTALAISQLDDPTFAAVMWRSIAWSVVCFAGLYVGAVWVIHRALQLHDWLAWAADVLGSIAVSLLALWLFLPVAAMIGLMYLDRIAGAVERRFYPSLPPPEGAPLIEQTWDGIVVALKILALNILALVFALILPGVGLALGWIIAAYAIGRGLFVAVAMRRMSRSMAESLYRANRGAVLVQGAVLALAAYVPVVNLLLPIIGVATMVHILDLTLQRNRYQKHFNALSY